MSEHCRHPVLLVDDEPDILFSLKGLLRREFELYTAASGREALEILADRPIHVVMTDQRMPEMTGVELLARVKQQFPNTIRIVFTGYADIKAVVDGINHSGLYRYVTKPWDPDDLISLLHDAALRYDEVVERRQLLADVQDPISRKRTVSRLVSHRVSSRRALGQSRFPRPRFNESTCWIVSRDSCDLNLEFDSGLIMKSEKAPVLLTVLVETSLLRWYVAGIELDGAAMPLIVSAPGNLSPYVGVPLGE